MICIPSWRQWAITRGNGFLGGSQEPVVAAKRQKEELAMREEEELSKRLEEELAKGELKDLQRACPQLCCYSVRKASLRVIGVLVRGC